MEGLIIKGVGGLYTVLAGGDFYQTKARGRFRREKMTPMIGDRVEFCPAEAGEDFGYILKIKPRTAQLERPPVANLDLLLVVLACRSPQPDLLLADKLLLKAFQIGVEAVVAINKIDLAPFETIAKQYRLSGLEVFPVSVQTGEGLDALKTRMRGYICAYAGQSGVGKSSLLNALTGKDKMETGSVSRIERGRHTTRHVELIALDASTWVADTPGFSLLETDLMDPGQLKSLYTEFAPYEGLCRFNGCNHVNEPGCAVKQAVDQGLLSEQRHERYKLLYQEFNEKWRLRYD